MALAACGGGGGGSLSSFKTNNGEMSITFDGDVPIFNWKPCTSFALRKCKPDEFKVVGLSVGLEGSNCTSSAGIHAAHWSIAGADGGTEPFMPPVRYGVAPEGAVVEAPPSAFTAGCRYRVIFHVLNAGAGIKFIETFCAGTGGPVAGTADCR